MANKTSELTNVYFDDLNKYESTEAINIRKKIINEIGNALYMSWFSESRIIVEQGRVTLFVATKFKNDRIETQFRDVLDALSLEVNCLASYASLKQPCHTNEEKEVASAEKQSDEFEILLSYEKPTLNPTREDTSDRGHSGGEGTREKKYDLSHIKKSYSRDLYNQLPIDSEKKKHTHSSLHTKTHAATDNKKRISNVTCNINDKLIRGGRIFYSFLKDKMHHVKSDEINLIFQ